MNSHTSRCRFCRKCKGFGCINELPGMGGFAGNINFQLNCAAWDKIKLPDGFSLNNKLPAIRLAPITGAVENVGYENEEDFYIDIITASYKAGIKLSIGDGWPDVKLQSGIAAIKKLKQSKPAASAAVFIKPYPNERIQERFKWSRPVAEIFGIDIDSYNIATLRRLVQLEKKTAEQLSDLKRKVDIPFAIKGIFNQEEVDLVKRVKPDIAVVSNHGGRVENRLGSTAEFLSEYGAQLRSHCALLWVDGGIRTSRDISVAGFLGASEVMIARPFISALCASGEDGVKEYARQLSGEC